MLDENPSGLTAEAPAENAGETDDIPDQQKKINILDDFWKKIVRLGLGDQVLHIGTNVLSLVLVIFVIWVMSSFYLKAQPESVAENSAQAAILPSPTPTLNPPTVLASEVSAQQNGISRLVVMHTTIPNKARYEVTRYTVEKGDTLISIADKFGLDPQTILWGNYYTLADNPESIAPGQELNILPVNGTYYEWHSGDKLEKVAEFFKVDPEEIINWPGNKIEAVSEDSEQVAIEAGAWLVIPGGTRPFVTWSAPEIPRSNPVVAKAYGSGYCSNVVEGGAIGSGTFVWPTDKHELSGFDFSPETNHWGIDLRGHEGVAIYAVDNGVIVYAGWNDRGYGNMVVIDHGNGFQSLYAHLAGINVTCGQSIWQTNVIGTMGNTGNSSGAHLHFEVGLNGGKINPWNVLPPP
jgi:murein DD-endopeptidase MepM/ murein hydrolase activator NlpD